MFKILFSGKTRFGNMYMKYLFLISYGNIFKI